MMLGGIGLRAPGLPYLRAERLGQIRAIVAQSRQRYGSPKITAVLRQAGERITQKTAARLMREAGWRSRVVKTGRLPRDHSDLGAPGGSSGATNVEMCAPYLTCGSSLPRAK